MTSHTILITAEYLNAHFFSVFLFVYVLQVLKALFYTDFRKLRWKVEYSGLFCATLYIYYNATFVHLLSVCFAALQMAVPIMKKSTVDCSLKTQITCGMHVFREAPSSAL